MPGLWTDDPINWRSFYASPCLGYEADVSYRLAKNRLADMVFLKRAGIINCDDCTVCHTTGTAWHLLISCQTAKPVWDFINSIKVKILKSALRIVDIYAGFPNPKDRKSSIVNYLCVLAKHTIYSHFTACSKTNVPLRPYLPIFKSKLKARIIKEFAWFNGRGITDLFWKKWWNDSSLFVIKDGSVIFLF